jgi:hypothetical protein
MKKGKIILALLFVSDPYLPEVIEPTMYDFNDPSSWFSVRMFPVWIILFL